MFLDIILYLQKIIPTNFFNSKQKGSGSAPNNESTVNKGLMQTCGPTFSTILNFLLYQNALKILKTLINTQILQRLHKLLNFLLSTVQCDQETCWYCAKTNATRRKNVSVFA